MCVCSQMSGGVGAPSHESSGCSGGACVLPLQQRRGRAEPREQRRQRVRSVVRVLPAERRRGRAEPQEQRQQQRCPPPRARFHQSSGVDAPSHKSSGGSGGSGGALSCA